MRRKFKNARGIIEENKYLIIYNDFLLIEKITCMGNVVGWHSFISNFNVMYFKRWIMYSIFSLILLVISMKSNKYLWGKIILDRTSM